MENSIAGLTAAVDKATGLLETYKEANEKRLETLADKGFVDSAVQESQEKIIKDFFSTIDALKAEMRSEQEKLAERLKVSGAMYGHDGRLGVPTDADFDRDAEISGKAHDGKKGVNAGLTAEELKQLHSSNEVGKYIRYGANGQPSAALQKLVGSDGGIFIEPFRQREIQARMFDSSPMRQVCRVQSISLGDAYTGRVRWGQAGSTWVGEREGASETATPTYKSYRIPVHRQEAKPLVSSEWIEDAAIDAEAELTNALVEWFSLDENTAFVTGTGVHKPEGFLNGATAATADASRAYGTLEHVVTGVNGGFHATLPFDTFNTLIAKLKTGYRQGSMWMMNRATLAAVLNIKVDSKYLWSMNDVQRSPWTFAILGYNVAEAEDMPVHTGTGALAIAFGNFKRGYKIVDRTGFRVLRDPYTAAPDIKFIATKRVGGGLNDSEAIKLMKFST